MRDLEPMKLDLSGTTLIEASAGTGKTYTLTTLYLRLLVEWDLLPADILVVTYTQAATAELRDRVRERIREAIAAGDAGEASEVEEEPRFSDEARALGLAARDKAAASGRPNSLRRALREFDEAAIFTIHGFCQRALGQNAFESGVAFDAELIEAADVLQQTLARDLWARCIGGEDPGFVEWLLRGKGSRWNFKPDLLKRDLLDPLGADEEMPVLPEATSSSDDETSDTQTLDANLQRAWERWAEIWPAAKDRVSSWILDADDLNRNKYRRGTVETKWLPQLDFWCAALAAGSGEQGSRDLPDWWQKLTPQGLAEGVTKKGTPLEDPVFDAFAAVEEHAQNLLQAYSSRALVLRRRVVDEARREAQRRRNERHQLVFDDLLSELRAALRPPAGNRLVEQLRRQYRYALIDEFQDTDPVQYEIFRRVWHRDGDSGREETSGGLVLIGDPKQAIYSFRGADLFTYLAAGKDAGDSVHGLSVNHRSDPGVIGAINEIFGRPTSAFGFDAIEFHRVAPRPEVSSRFEALQRSTAGMRVLLAEYERFASEAGFSVMDESEPEEGGKKKKKKKPEELPLRFGRTELMQALARDIADLLESDATIDGRPVVPKDIAVLCRRKVELDRARRALEVLGIPCVDRGDADVFESREAWEFVCVLRAMLRSGDESLLRAALATGALGWNAGPLAALSDESGDLSEVSERYAEYGRIWRESGFMRAFEAWRRHEDVTRRLLRYVDGERRLTNWLHLAELLQRVASERSPSRTGLVNWVERAIADPDVRKVFGSEASLLRLESDDQAVSLVTLHRSKGLEYEIVYLPALWEDASPRGTGDQNAKNDVGPKPPVRCHDPVAGERILDLGGPCYAEHLERQKEETRSESLRLLYVGLTRAKRQCVLMWGAIGKGSYASTPLAWLLAAPDAGNAGKTWAEVAKEIREWDDARWRRAFTALAESAGSGSLAIESADWRPRDRWHASGERPPALVFERESRPMPPARVTTSFSGLTRSAHRLLDASIGPEAIGRDVDADVGDASAAESDQSPDLAGEMDAFPRGADAGTLLHEVLEQVDFASWTEGEVRRTAAQALERNAFAPAHEDQILHVVRSVASTPLRSEPESFRLADVAPGQLRPEMEFTLAAPGNAESEGFTPLNLSSLLARTASGTPMQSYAERVAGLSWRRLEGFLRGFIDAVFFDGERYFLVDYKSNHLGSRRSDYAPENLLAPMISHDYVLQYLIYSIALDRHLSQTLAGYSYEAHFGGAYYLFLRGMSEAHPPGCGVFFDRPEESLVRGVTALLGSSIRGGA
jgi:exodeoxyribonuclease V beta subunit